MIQSQERASDMMVNSPAYWSRVADYLLMYDQVVIPTGNLQILSVLRFMLGDDVLLELLETRSLVFSRFDQWFGYLGTAGVVFFKVGDGPENKRDFPNMATSHFLPLDEAVDAAFIAMNPPSTAEARGRFKRLLIDYTAQLATGRLLEEVRAEAYSDIKGSPYLQDLLSIRNAGRSIENLVEAGPDTITVFNPHVSPEKHDPPEIRAVLRVVFENLLLGIAGSTQAAEITGDDSTLSVLKAKGQRLGLSPYGRAAFAQIQQVSGVPDIGTSFANRHLSARQLLDLRVSRHAQVFRDWLAAGTPSSSAGETVRRYVESVGKPGLIESLPVKLLRFATTTGWGALEPISGALVDAADTFLLSKWFPQQSPKLFMRQAKVVTANSPVVRAPVHKGRDRNALCSCGSGTKYKHCCGRLG
jgi:SEC-C motif